MDKSRILERLGERGERLIAQALARNETRVAAILRHGVDQVIEHRNGVPLLAAFSLKRIPVTIEQFIGDRDFLGGRIDVWPEVRIDLLAINDDVFIGRQPCHEALLGGATGIGKSLIARITILYQVYLLTCLRCPQKLYGLEPTTRLVFPLQSVTPDLTQRVLYEPLRETFEAMPFAQKYLQWNRRRTASLEIAGNIHIVPLIANPQMLLGQAIPGAVIDEANFMRIVERSVRVAGPRGQGGRYDQVEELYRELSQRRKSRFGRQGISIGCIVVSSSAHYSDDFLDRRMREVIETDEPGVFWSHFPRYQVVPQDRYSGETFRFLVGKEGARPRILRAGEAAPNGADVYDVPVEHLEEFRRDPAFAQRTIIGRPLDSLEPFIGRPEKILDAIARGEARGLEHWVDQPDVTLARDGFPRWRDDAMPQDRRSPRFVHIDLSATRDACGIAIVRLAGITHIRDPETPGNTLKKPRLVVEAAISIRPDPDSELIISELRGWLLQLIDRYGINICMVTMDGYQSRDTLQTLRHRGIVAEELSVDSSPEAYEALQEALYEDRVDFVDSDTLRRELVQLERNPETGRIDHPPRGSKDVADAVAGAVLAAIRSRALRRETGYFEDEGRRIVSRQPRRRRTSGSRPGVTPGFPQID